MLTLGHRITSSGSAMGVGEAIRDDVADGAGGDFEPFLGLYM